MQHLPSIRSQKKIKVIQKKHSHHRSQSAQQLRRSLFCLSTKNLNKKRIVGVNTDLIQIVNSCI